MILDSELWVKVVGSEAILGPLQSKYGAIVDRHVRRARNERDL